MKRKFPAKLKPRGYRELVYKLTTYSNSAEFATTGNYYLLDTMQAASHLLDVIHRNPWDYKAYTQQDMFDSFERHFAELSTKLSPEAFNVSVADLFFDALDYLVGDRYLIKWKRNKSSEPEFILHYQYNAFGSPADAQERFGNYKSEDVQPKLMKVWLENNTITRRAKVDPEIERAERLLQEDKRRLGHRDAEPSGRYTQEELEAIVSTLI